MTFMSRRDVVIINNKGIYVFLRAIIFMPKCDFILSIHLWVWKKKRFLGKIAKMGGDLFAN